MGNPGMLQSVEAQRVDTTEKLNNSDTILRRRQWHPTRLSRLQEMVKDREAWGTAVHAH